MLSACATRVERPYTVLEDSVGLGVTGLGEVVQKVRLSIASIGYSFQRSNARLCLGCGPQAPIYKFSEQS
jgi:hypothetical protein